VPVETRHAPGSSTRERQAAAPVPRAASQLAATRDAFDSVAADYDGPRGNNALIQDMRAEMWRWLDRVFADGSRLIDLGCGTGLDAVHLARAGHEVTALDWSPQMLARTAARAAEQRLSARIRTVGLGAHELERLEGDGCFDGAYSNLGALNCVPDLERVSSECARLLRPGGALLFSVIGRRCPWELLHYARLGRWARARVRFARDWVAVGLNHRTVWTHYYTPREFYRSFARDFELAHYRGLCVFAPPPYLAGIRERHPGGYERLRRLDARCAGWPLLRGLGDHFLIVMRKR
jgi:SAM-dependent methyltransferase